MYYHFDYVGDPKSYKWINTISLAKTWEQLHLTYERGADRIWVVNVGDLKPLELPIDYFLNLAYDCPRWGSSPENVSTYHLSWAAREFTSSDTADPLAAEIADIMETYGFYAARRRFEHLTPTTYSVIHYSEAASILSQWRNLTSRAESVYASLPSAVQPAFFELVLHPIKGGTIVHEIYILSALNNLHASQRRNSANYLAENVLRLFKDDLALTKEYHSLLDGKWEGMMRQTHLGYSFWQQPMRDAVPPLAFVQLEENSLAGAMGLTVEGSNGSVPGDDYYNVVQYNNQTLVPPILDPYHPAGRVWVDVYAKGNEPFTWTATPRKPWVRIVPASGYIEPGDEDGDMRVWIEVDWDNAPAGSSVAFIDFKSDAEGGYGFAGQPSVHVLLNNSRVPVDFHGFVESAAVVAMEAEHYSRATSVSNSSNSSVYYETIPLFGRTLSGVSLLPALAPRQTPPSSPALEYDFYSFTASTRANINIYLAATLNQNPGRPMAYAVAIDGQEVRTVEFVPIATEPVKIPEWNKAVAEGNTWISTTRGWAVGKGEHTLRWWALEPGVVLERVVVDLGGVKPSYLGPPESVLV